MSAFTKAKKAFQKNHKERGQLKHRNHLGLLEKHKDYVLRARDYHKKQAKLKTLREKALNKNPDEFYFKMIKSKTKDGVHQVTSGKQHTQAEMKKMKVQDLNYVNMKRSAEAKKIEKLKSSLHLLEDVEEEDPKNQHIIFVDSKKEARNFDAAKHFNTLPELFSRAYNRPNLETLKDKPIESVRSGKALKKLNKQRDLKYRELQQRIERKDKITKMAEKLELQKHLMGKGRKVKKSQETDDKPAVFKWKKERRK